MFSEYFREPLEYALPSFGFDHRFDKDPLFSMPPESSLLPSSRRRTNSKSMLVKPAKSDFGTFKVMFDVKHFDPSDILVKVKDDIVHIHAKHEEKADEHGFISREFTRRYKLPSDVRLNDVTASMSRDGLLVISAPKKVEKLRPNERVVPIVVKDSALSAIGVLPPKSSMMGVENPLYETTYRDIKVQKDD